MRPTLEFVRSCTPVIQLRELNTHTSSDGGLRLEMCTYESVFKLLASSTISLVQRLIQCLSENSVFY